MGHSNPDWVQIQGFTATEVDVSTRPREGLLKSRRGKTTSWSRAQPPRPGPWYFYSAEQTSIGLARGCIYSRCRFRGCDPNTHTGQAIYFQTQLTLGEEALNIPSSDLGRQAIIAGGWAGWDRQGRQETHQDPQGSTKAPPLIGLNLQKGKCPL